jgi:hypothetical protein
LALRHRNRLPWPESDFVENPAVLSQSDFIVGAAIKIIEDCSGKPPLRHPAQIVNIHRV